jgi:hypothetical protein
VNFSVANAHDYILVEVKLATGSASEPSRLANASAQVTIFWGGFTTTKKQRFTAN